MVNLGFNPEHLSHSSVESYSRCSWSYKLAKVDRVKQSSSWATVAGGAIHLATETLDLADFGIETGGPKTFMDALDYQLAEQKRQFDVDEADLRATGRKSREWPNARDRAYWEANGQGHINRWRAFLRTGMDIAIIDSQPAIEIEFRVEVPSATDGDPIVLLGYIDRIIGNSTYGLGCIDIKTGASAPDSSTQLLRYGLARSVLAPDEPIRWGSFFMTQDGGGLTPPVDLDGKTAEQIHLPIQRAHLGITSGVFLPNIGRHCSYCFTADFCEYRP